MTPDLYARLDSLRLQRPPVPPFALRLPVREWAMGGRRIRPLHGYWRTDRHLSELIRRLLRECA